MFRTNGLVLIKSNHKCQQRKKKHFIDCDSIFARYYVGAECKNSIIMKLYDLTNI